MTRWPTPALPTLPGTGGAVQIWDTATSSLQPATQNQTARMYVCGITPYDATHLGHAATYVTFDLLNRALRDAGHDVVYVQNVTDVDDPLLERANATGVDWRDLAADQTDLFARDMTELAVIPPQVYLGVVESLPLVISAVEKLVDAGLAYAVPGHDDEPDGDLYLDVYADNAFGQVSHLLPAEMAEIFAERGGDPDRPGKKHPLDPLLWRVARPGEPSWAAGTLPAGRPGWHIECTAIALEHLGMAFDIQGGGSDLVFPHHEMGASHAHLLTGQTPYARTYVHAGMVGYEGHKMSKSRGNLVLVSRLLAAGHESAAIRLALLAHHYRSDWEWTQSDLAAAQVRLQEWRRAVTREQGPDGAALVAGLRAAMANDLDAPAALQLVDEWAAADGGDTGAPALVATAVNALLGVHLGAEAAQ